MCKNKALAGRKRSAPYIEARMLTIVFSLHETVGAEEVSFPVG
jgi:hypothetical protein